MGWLRRASGSEGSRRPTTVEERVAAIEPGVPGRCPACDGLGYIDNLDIGRRFQLQHCKDCGHRWEYLFDADGLVVGLTELDADGHPVARTRVRARTLAAERAAPGAPEPAATAVEADPAPVEPRPVTPAAAMIDVGPDVVIDLRTSAPAEPVTEEPTTAEPVDLTGRGPDQMSPAEWLRHSVGR